MATALKVLTSEAPGCVRRPALIEAAARAPVVGGRSGAEYREIPCRSVLNRCDSDRVPFEWTINPYRGCEFGCRYCYARYTHEYIGLEDTRLFETEIFAKTGAAAALERDLPPGKRLKGGIAIGTATDPYQPAERRLLITRRLLEVLARREGLRLSICTKSHLVTRDLDLLHEIARRNALTVSLTITTLSRRLARILEPRAPRPALRLEAVRDLARAGVTTGVFVMPVMPAVNDAPASLEAIVAAAARAGAGYLAHQVLFLRSSAKREFFPFLAEHFPRLLPRYRRAFASSAYYAPDYVDRLDALVSTLRRRYRLAARPVCRDEGGRGEAAASGPGRAAPAGLPAQMALGF